MLGLPLIRNEKTVDPSDKASPRVIQIETAMGAAVEVFEGAQALEVDRSRFLPVKSTNDLLALRSDVYDARRRLHGSAAPTGSTTPPLVDLDPDYYKLIADFDARFPDGPPSLREATSLDGARRLDVRPGRRRASATSTIDADGLARHDQPSRDRSSSGDVVADMPRPRVSDRGCAASKST